MGLFDDVFSGRHTGAEVSRQLPDDKVNEIFGEVNVRNCGEQLEVNFTVLMPPAREGWQTGVALDASSSMRSDYGRRLDPQSIPKTAIDTLRREGLMESTTSDGGRVARMTQAAIDRLRQLGVEVRNCPNIVEPIAQRFISYLAQELDEDGGTTVAYWACGRRGDEYEVVGDFTAAQCRTLKLAGPQKKEFGNETHLTPVARYFVDRFTDAENGMYVFITDGRIDDMNELMEYSTALARQIASGKRNPVKFVLIGIGDKIDKDQMQQLDDLDTGTEVDIWDHKIAREMTSMLKLFAEVVSENMIVADTGHIRTSSGARVAEFPSREFPRGIPAKISFTMPASDPWFELVVGDDAYRQNVTFPDG